MISTQAPSPLGHVGCRWASYIGITCAMFDGSSINGTVHAFRSTRENNSSLEWPFIDRSLFYNVPSQRVLPSLSANRLAVASFGALEGTSIPCQGPNLEAGRKGGGIQQTEGGLPGTWHGPLQLHKQQASGTRCLSWCRCRARDVLANKHQFMNSPASQSSNHFFFLSVTLT